MATAAAMGLLLIVTEPRKYFFYVCIRSHSFQYNTSCRYPLLFLWYGISTTTKAFLLYIDPLFYPAAEYPTLFLPLLSLFSRTIIPSLVFILE